MSFWQIVCKRHKVLIKNDLASTSFRAQRWTQSLQQLMLWESDIKAFTVIIYCSALPIKVVGNLANRPRKESEPQTSVLNIVENYDRICIYFYESC